MRQTKEKRLGLRKTLPREHYQQFILILEETVSNESLPFFPLRLLWEKTHVFRKFVDNICMKIKHSGLLFNTKKLTEQQQILFTFQF